LVKAGTSEISNQLTLQRETALTPADERGPNK